MCGVGSGVDIWHVARTRESLPCECARVCARLRVRVRACVCLASRVPCTYLADAFAHQGLLSLQSRWCEMVCIRVVVGRRKRLTGKCCSGHDRHGYRSGIPLDCARARRAQCRARVRARAHAGRHCAARARHQFAQNAGRSQFSYRKRHSHQTDYVHGRNIIHDSRWSESNNPGWRRGAGTGRVGGRENKGSGFAKLASLSSNYCSNLIGFRFASDVTINS